MAGLAAGGLLSMIDSSVITVAIPDIASRLDASLTATGWTLSGYLLALAAGLPASAYLAKRYGTRRVYLLSLVAFTVISGLCAAAPSILVLDLARIAQGLAAAPLIPLSLTLVYGGQPGMTSPVSSLLPVLVFFLAPALGPTVGGLLISAGDWRLIFLINLPIGLLGALGVLRAKGHVVPDEPDRNARLDLFGLLLLSAGLALVIYATAEGPRSGWLSKGTWPFWAAGLVLATAYVAWSHGRSNPALRLDLLRSSRNALMVVLCALGAIVLFAVLFLIPVFLQQASGASAITAGLVLLPQGLAMGGSIRLGNWLVGRWALRPVVVLGMVTLTLSTLLLLLVTNTTSSWFVALVLTGRGIGLGLVVTPLLDALLLPLTPEEMPHGSTLFNVVQRLGGSLGVALIASVFTARELTRVSTSLRALGIEQIPESAATAFDPAQVPAAFRVPLEEALTAGFHDTVLVIAGLGFAGVLAAAGLRSARPRAAATSASVGTDSAATASNETASKS